MVPLPAAGHNDSCPQSLGLPAFAVYPDRAPDTSLINALEHPTPSYGLLGLFSLQAMPDAYPSVNARPPVIENAALNRIPSKAMDRPGQMDRSSQMDRMNRMYRYTRHIYDLSRALYLPGRDSAIAQVAQRLPAHGSVLEVGCGTGRNLRHLRRHRPDAHLFGLDAASVMLDTARRTLRSARVTLCHGVAKDVHPSRFGVSGFDVVLCSYVFSMMATPLPALRAALGALRPGGHLVVVDFGTAAALPPPLRQLLRRWLRLFGVAHRPAVAAFVQSESARGTLTLAHEHHLRGRYAELLVCRVPETGYRGASPQATGQSLRRREPCT